MARNKKFLTATHVGRNVGNYFFGMDILDLKFFTHVINIEMLSLQKFYEQENFLSPREGVKIGSRESFLTATPCLYILHIYFCIDLLDLKLGEHVLNTN